MPPAPSTPTIVVLADPRWLFGGILRHGIEDLLKRFAPGVGCQQGVEARCSSGSVEARAAS